MPMNYSIEVYRDNDCSTESWVVVAKANGVDVFRSSAPRELKLKIFIVALFHLLKNFTESDR